MGIYSEYLDRGMGFPELAAERKAQLKRVSDLREGRDVLVYAAALNVPVHAGPLITLNNSDLLAITDQLSNLTGKALDLILETPGGSGEVAEQIVRLVRRKYSDVAVIVPGTAKSAGTIMAFAADEILMGPTSALGPIDAQMTWQGKVFSADALIKGFEKIKANVDAEKKLNLAYVPILQQLSPGELQHAQNSLDFARNLVRDWLVRYKFKDWSSHSSSGKPVTPDEKQARADEIAAQLCDHGRWLTHGRSIILEDLQNMRLLITDYSQNSQLADAIGRYYTLLQMMFDSTTIYKVFETPTSQIHRFQAPNAPIAAAPQNPDIAALELECPSCKSKMKVQANLGASRPLQNGAIEFPKNNKLACSNCRTEIDLTEARRQVELQTKKPIV
jgi:ClpP class serine protease